MKIAEQNLIGSLLVDSDAIGKVSELISGEMIEDAVASRIFVEYQKGYDNNYKVTVPLLLQNIDDFSRERVAEVIKDCTVGLISSVDVISYAEVIKRDYKSKLAGEILSQAKLKPSVIDEGLGELIAQLQDLAEDKKNTIKSLAVIAEENRDKYFCDDQAKRVNLGFKILDEYLGGLEGGDMIVIGARPGVGKSAFVTQVAGNMAANGVKVGFYNLEMQEKQVYERFIVANSGLSLRRLRRALAFQRDEEELFTKANAKLSKMDNIMISTGAKTMSEIRQEVRHMGYDIIIIDYLQLLGSDVTYKGNRYAEVGAISKAIKGLAMELNIPIIALSQLNRASEFSKSKEPTMAELREAGDIEQDASVIMLLWNLDERDRTLKGLKIAKQRQGETGKIVYRFRGDHMKFEETAESMQKWEKVPKDEPTPFD